MSKEHGRKSSFVLPMTSFSCQYCPFEQRLNTKKKLQRHIENCERNFQLENNLVLRVMDCDIPLYAPPKTPSSEKDAKATPAAVPSNQKNQPSTSLAPGTPTVVKPATKTTFSFEICEICGAFTKDRKSLRTHLIIAHQIEFPLSAMRENGVPPLTCGSCPEKFWTRHGLDSHKLMSHQGHGEAATVSVTVCPLCKRTRLTDVLAHLAQQHRITLTDMFYQRYCALCLLELHTEKAFEDHMVTSHSTLFPRRGVLFDGILSGDHFKPNSSNQSRQHSATLSAVIHRNKLNAKFGVATMGRNFARTFTCPVCMSQFTSIEDLSLHFEQVHAFKCSRCHQRCSSLEFLQRHFRSWHSNIFEKCQICGESVRIGLDMVDHFHENHEMLCSILVERVNEMRDTSASSTGDASRLADAAVVLDRNTESDGDEPIKTELRLKTNIPSNLDSEGDTASVTSESDAASVTSESDFGENNKMHVEARDESPVEMQIEGRDESPDKMQIEGRNESPVKIQVEERDESPAKIKVEARDGSPVKMQIEGRDELPVKIQVEGRDESPVKIQVEGRDESPVNIQVEGRDESPVKMRIEGRDESPVKIQVEGRDESPVKIQVEARDESPVKMQVEGRDELPIEIHVEGRDELPTKIKVEERGDLPTEIQVEGSDELPVMIHVEGRDESPANIDMEEISDEPPTKKRKISSVEDGKLFECTVELAGD